MKSAARAAPPRIGAAVMAGAKPDAEEEPAAAEEAPAAAEPAAEVAEPAAEEASAAAEEAALEAALAAPEISEDALAAAEAAEPEREVAAPAAPSTEYRVVEPMVEVVIALPAEETVVTTASVVTGTLEPATPLAPVEAASAAPPAVTPTAEQTETP